MSASSSSSSQNPSVPAGIPQGLPQQSAYAVAFQLDVVLKQHSNRVAREALKIVCSTYGLGVTPSNPLSVAATALSMAPPQKRGRDKSKEKDNKNGAANRPQPKAWKKDPEYLALNARHNFIIEELKKVEESKKPPLLKEKKAIELQYKVVRARHENQNSSPAFGSSAVASVEEQKSSPAAISSVQPGSDNRDPKRHRKDAVVDEQGSGQIAVNPVVGVLAQSSAMEIVVSHDVTSPPSAPVSAKPIAPPTIGGSGVNNKPVTRSSSKK